MTRQIAILVLVASTLVASQARAQLYETSHSTSVADPLFGVGSEASSSQVGGWTFQQEDVPSFFESRDDTYEVQGYRGLRPVTRKLDEDEAEELKGRFEYSDESRDTRLGKIFDKHVALNEAQEGEEGYEWGKDGYSVFEKGKAFASQDGRLQATVKATALGVDAQAGASLFVGTDGAELQADASACATLAELKGTAKATAGDEYTLGADCHAEGSAFAGAEVEAKTTVVVARDALPQATSGVDAFAGAKAAVTYGCAGILCGMRTELGGSAEASAGAGVEAKAYFVVDWKKKTVRMGGYANGTVGLGAGQGTDVTIDLSGATDEGFRKFVSCMLDRLREMHGAWKLANDVAAQTLDKAFGPAGEALMDVWSRETARQVQWMFDVAQAADGLNVSRLRATRSVQQAHRPATASTYSGGHGFRRARN